MNTEFFSTTAARIIEAASQNAHQGIDAYLQGGQRLAELAGRQWDRSFSQASDRLTPETRKNAARARQVLGNYYATGLKLSAHGAGRAVDSVLSAASGAVERAAAFAQTRSGKPG